MRNRCFLLLLLFLIANVYGFAQSKAISGIVLDSNNEPVMGANVSISGTTNGTITDLDGNFTLKNVSSDAKLKVSYIGFLTQTISLNGQSSIKILLKEDSNTLDEVVVVGYGTQKKSDVTGALVSITEKQIKQRPVENALQAMQGKAPGVDITTNSRPGQLGEVRIRGVRSINAGNDPLYVVDGIPLTAGSVADINPNDIASMEILKDASSTAIYGSRGANGVILISTKKGKSGKCSVNYDGTVTFSRINSVTDWMGSGELLDWQRSAYINGGTYGGAYGNAPDPSRDRSLFFGTDSYMDRIVRTAYKLNDDGTPVLRTATQDELDKGYAAQVPVYNSSDLYNQNWTNLITRTGITNNHQISLSSGTDKSTLYMSFAYLNQKSPMKDQDYERFTVNINGDITPTKWLKVGMGLNATHSIQNYGMVSNSSNSVAKDSYGLSLGMMPYAPAYDDNGKVLNPGVGVSWHNLLVDINQGTNETRNYGAMFSSYAEITFFPWLKWRTNFGAQYRNSRVGSYYGEDYTNPYQFDSTAPGVAYDSQTQNMSWTLENLIYINKTFNKIHSFGLTLMQSAEKYRTEGLSDRAYEVTYPTSMWYDIGDSNTSKTTAGSSLSQEQRTSYMARINYSLMDRYLLTLTGRYDGASMLAKGNKWDFFPSAALGWRIDQENFIKNIKWISSLKLRLGYGVTGNASVSPYSTSGTMTSSQSSIPFGTGNVTTNTVGAKANVMPNKNLSWEKTAATNIGIDFGFLNGRISGSAEVYQANTYDLLMSRSLPAVVGYVSLQDNIGKTRNKGFELSLSTVNVKTRNFTWQTDFTFSMNKEEIRELAGGKVDDTANGWFIGKPIDEVWTYKYDRLWQNTDQDKEQMAIYKANGLTFIPGQAKVRDQEYIPVAVGTDNSTTVTLADGSTRTFLNNGFGTLDSKDYKFLGSFRPKWVGGLNTTLTYKNWSLNTFIYARMGNLYYGLTQTYGRRKESNVWSATNPGGKYPQPTTQTFSNYNGYMGYTHGNMVMVRNIGLSYTIPNDFLKKLNMSSAQIYCQVTNPFLFGGELVNAGINPDDTTGWDSKTSATNYVGGQTNNTAIIRSYVLGLRFGF